MTNKLDENEQYLPHEFYYPDEETNENANFHWEELDAKQGSQEEVEAFLTTPKAETTV